jgi:hypothetical protein
MPDSDLTIPPGWLRIKSAARYADVSPKTINVWLELGLRRSKVRNIVLIKAAWLDEWLEQFQVGKEKKARIRGVVNEVLEGL